MRLALALMSIVVFSLIHGCATISGNESDPRKASTWQILTNKGAIEEGLKTKREYLKTLNAQVAVLDDQLLASQAELFKVKRQLATSEMPKKQLEALQHDIASMEAQQAELATEVDARKGEIATLENSINESNANSTELDNQLVTVKKRVDSMSQKLSIVNASVKRAATSHMKYSADM